MVTITIIATGKLSSKFFADGCDEYIKRLSSFCKVNIIELKEQRLLGEGAALEQKVIETESENILKLIDKKNAKKIALCVEGKQLSSENFAQMLETTEQSFSEIIFIIGGSLGLSERLKNSVDVKLSLSNMTFVHQMSRMILLEQIYRGFTINKNIKYHK